MISERRHRHHLIPKHMGGTDDEENLTPPISIDTHAEFHRQLWLLFKKKEDYIAWKCLSGRMSPEDARLAAAKEGQKKSALYQETRKLTGEGLRLVSTFESCSKGGKNASKALVAWQVNNQDKFKTQSAKNGRASSLKRKIPHTYMGKTYDSKQELQKEYSMYNNLFYKLLKEGVILRHLKGKDRDAQ